MSMNVRFASPYILNSYRNTYVVFTNFTQIVFIHNKNNEHALTPISEEASLQKGTNPVPERNCDTF